MSKTIRRQMANWILWQSFSITEKKNKWKMPITNDSIVAVVCEKLCVGIQVELIVARKCCGQNGFVRNSQITKPRAHYSITVADKIPCAHNLQNTLNRNGILVLIRNLDCLNISLQAPNYTHSIIILKKAQARNNSSHCNTLHAYSRIHISTSLWLSWRSKYLYTSSVRCSCGPVWLCRSKIIMEFLRNAYALCTPRSCVCILFT